MTFRVAASASAAAAPPPPCFEVAAEPFLRLLGLAVAAAGASASSAALSEDLVLTLETDEAISAVVDEATPFGLK